MAAEKKQFRSLTFVKQPPFLEVLLLALAILTCHWCKSEPVGGITLEIVGSPTNSLISWPYPSRGFELQSATNLSTANWQPAIGTAVSIAATGKSPYPSPNRPVSFA